MQTLPEITEVEASFASWRSNRRSRSERIPDELWQQVRTLLPHYKTGVIARRLNLSGSLLKQLKICCGKKEDRQKTQAAKPADDSFVQAVHPALTQYNEVDRCSVTIKGAHKTLQLELSASALQQFIPSLIELL